MAGIVEQFVAKHGLLGGDDDSQTQCLQIRGRCLILDHQLGASVHKRPKGDDCLLEEC